MIKTKRLVACVNAALACTAILFIPQTAYADISGMVFRDFNANGILNTDANMQDVGVANATVKAFDAAGTEKATTQTTADGSYSLIGLTAGTKYRVEFSWAETWLKSGVAGGTSVQFAEGIATGINLALNAPDEYSSPTDPRIMTPTYRSGTGDGSTDPAIQSFPRSNSGLNSDYPNGQGPKPATDAIIGDIGSTWGIAWQANKKRAYAASFLKRHTGLAHGLGAVYVLDEINKPGQFVKYFNLQGVTPVNAPTETIDLGSVCRDAVCAAEAGRTGIANDYVLPDTTGTNSVDMDAFYKIGKVGFGDIDMQPGTDTLWLVNAYQQALISIDVSGTAAILPGEVKQYKIADLAGAPSCQGGNLRPWALNFSQGKGFLGITCDAFNSRNAADLKASVLMFDPNNLTAGFSSVLSFPLNYSRHTLSAEFQPWLDEATATTGSLSTANDQTDLAQPLLSDIEFDDKGNMYLNIMDIFTHQTGSNTYKPYSGGVNPDGTTQLVMGISNGDFLKACKLTTGFSLEGSADCPINFNTNGGPNGIGEFFEDTSGDTRTESANGAMAILHGSGQIDAIAVDPHPTGQTGQQWWASQGINSYSLTNGAITNWYSLYASTDPSFFSKGAGLGDLELLTDAAPTEIGNRIWLDNDSDGIQDADETGLPQVNVVLGCNSGTVTATTDAAGQYLFSTLNNAAFMSAGELCTISIDNSQTALSGLKPTLKDADNITTNDATTDLRDSDATDKTTTAEIQFVVGREGENNHTLDFGYTIPKPDLKLTKSVDKSSVKLGETAIYTLTLENESDTTANNIEITDSLPSSVTLITATPSLGTFTNGIWTIPSLAGRQKVSLMLEVTIK